MFKDVALKNYVAGISDENLIVFIAVCIYVPLEIFKTLYADKVCMLKRFKLNTPPPQRLIRSNVKSEMFLTKRTSSAVLTCLAKEVTNGSKVFQSKPEADPITKFFIE